MLEAAEAAEIQLGDVDDWQKSGQAKWLRYALGQVPDWWFSMGRARSLGYLLQPMQMATNPIFRIKDQIQIIFLLHFKM